MKQKDFEGLAEALSESYINGMSQRLGGGSMYREIVNNIAQWLLRDYPKMDHHNFWAYVNELVAEKEE